jgi:hypothetical protein
LHNERGVLGCVNADYQYFEETDCIEPGLFQLNASNQAISSLGHVTRCRRIIMSKATVSQFMHTLHQRLTELWDTCARAGGARS